MIYVVRLKDEVQGKYREFQVAMNHASDLVNDMSDIEDFSSDMVTINKRPFNTWVGGY